MNERECRRIDSEPPSEDDILVAWALRFDGWKYCEQTSWAEEDRLRATDLFVDTLVPPADPLKQLAVFFMLQRYLYKWGGETLSHRSKEWKAFRTLFLMTANYDVDPRWQAEEWYVTWEKQYHRRADSCIGLIARAHSSGYPYAENFMLTSRDREALTYYNIETYLFKHVGPRFRENGVLSAFDFFSIVIWKANRAKSKIAKRLLKGRVGRPLDEIVAELSRSLHAAKGDEERLRLLWDWGFRLPMASAILAVLWPNQFTVYDFRVCEQLKEFKSLGNCEKFDAIWTGYKAYREAVWGQVSEMPELRDKDRVLWARSAMNQLAEDIGRGFDKVAVTTEDTEEITEKANTRDLTADGADLRR
jgi:hypothetical protein